MIIERVELHRVALPLKHRFETSSHSKRSIDHILVRLVDEDGVDGWGEIAAGADPYYSPETTDTSWLIAQRYLVPSILGKGFPSARDLEASWRRVRGHHFAKAGFSIAAWALEARRSEVGLAALLGGTRSEVVAGVSLGIERSTDDLVVEVARHVAAGYPRVKLKIAPGWDVEPVRAVRSAFPGIALHVDANGAYPATDEAFAAMAALDRWGLTMIEQPFAPRDLLAHARLQERIETPVCLDESVEELDDLATMLRLRAGRVLNIKVSRMGGLENARRAHDLAAEHDVPVWCGGMHEFGIGRLANIAISSLPNFVLPSDVSASDKYYERDIIVPPVSASRGVVAVPHAPGLGHDVDIDWLTENRTDLLTAHAPSSGRRRADRPAPHPHTERKQDMPHVVLAQANPALLFVGVDDPGFDGAVLREVDPYAQHLSVFDLGFIRGDGVFEATSVVDGTALAMRLHIARLRRSARLTDLPEFTSERAWLDVVDEALALYGRPDPATIRILVSRGADPVTTVGRSLHPGTPTVFVFVDTSVAPRRPSLSATLVSRGYTLAQASSADEPWLLLGAKTLSYAQNMAVYREAARRGFDIGIYTTTDGYVLEGGTSTIVIRKDGVLRTTVPDAGILHGTTQQELFAYAENRGIPHEYGHITVDELLAADHVFNMGGSNLQTIERIDETLLATDPGFAADAVEFWRTHRAEVEAYTMGAGVQRWL